MDSYKTRLKDITTFIFDVDGVMTNGKIIYTHDGKIDRQFYAKDGYAIKYAISKGSKEVYASFISSASQARYVKDLIGENVSLISKVETALGVSNINEIIELSDKILLRLGAS